MSKTTHVAPGKWMAKKVGRGYKGYPYLYVFCSECGESVLLGSCYKYCPWCGTKMDAVELDSDWFKNLVETQTQIATLVPDFHKEEK